jgi:hypothetical protein
LRFREPSNATAPADVLARVARAFAQQAKNDLDVSQVKSKPNTYNIIGLAFRSAKSSVSCLTEPHADFGGEKAQAAQFF